ncbi:hypothetical protein [Winogradskyella sp. PG-2]|uniref:hypothetical protein n=1 Tax=Winogradskyella sp. PG-2 TaxID=754409 RepID=UPI000458864E|nr:hypothetical protein [Winogradskyella sp. PG-2]BAO75178.1 hypothetical protein WPG_0948 [Winogradskyella sp. PG-2]
MKNIKIIGLALVLVILLNSCNGDQKTVVGQDYGDTSFVNDSFKGNKKNFSELPEDLCEFLDEAAILKGYDNATSVKFDAGSSFINKNCQFNVIFFDDLSQYIRGSIFITENKSEGDGWKESWEMRKKRFKSAEYVPNLGMATIWIGKQKKLEIKMKGYDVMITVPPKMKAKNKIDNEADVKNVAISIAKNTNLF